MTPLLIIGFITLGSSSAFSPSNQSNGHKSHRVLLDPLFIASKTSSSSFGIRQKNSSSVRAAKTTSGPYIRIQKRGRHYDVQTAVTTFQKRSENNNNSRDENNNKNNTHDSNNNRVTTTSVDLHSQIHFGDESYFNYFNDDQHFGSLYDKVLYELIVEDKFLTQATTDTDTTTTTPLLRTLLPTSDNLNPIAPTAADRNTASQYGLQCQVDGIQYCREDWIHADVTRQEFLNVLSKEEENNKGMRADDDASVASASSNNPQQPLWAMASTTATYPGSEAFTALLRPLTTTSNSASVQLTRRLFTHLFLPGDALSGWIRAILWFGVPAPELSISLVDWSSLSYIGRGKRRRRRQGGVDSSSSEDAAEGRGIAPISPIAAPVLLSLLTGNWGTARRLVFGQVLVGGQASEDTSKNGVLIQKRNEHAMKVLRETLRVESDRSGEGNAADRRIALLYGAGHCQDLHGRLEEEGYVPVRTEWRTAFRASAPKWGDYFNVERDFSRTSVSAEAVKSETDTSSELSQFGKGVINSLSTSALESAAVGLVVLPLYLLIGGLDWVSTLQEVGVALDSAEYIDAAAAMILYLVRHVALYVGISKFVIDWGGDNGFFEEEQ